MTAAGAAGAVDSGPVAAPPTRTTAPAAPAPETLYNEGHELARKQDWKAAEAAYRDALHGRAAFPEAWNGLGYVLRHQGRYDESVRAYQEALRLRPDYAAALEYLGEAYVKLGRMEDARGLLERLRALNAPEAVELAKSISAAYTGQPGAAAPARRW
ncbi:MAG TPA: tetratricopeptide repeat protein [Terriglobales bacterium]|nr:tetratricopeptide repeat protein [Terriglobales bacterium]